MDELYNATVLPITKGIAHVLRLFEVYVVEGIAVLIAGLVKGMSGLGSRLQNGNVQCMELYNSRFARSAPNYFVIYGRGFTVNGLLLTFFIFSPLLGILFAFINAKTRIAYSAGAWFIRNGASIWNCYRPCLYIRFRKELIDI